jgi:hypothetical protein
VQQDDIPVRHAIKNDIPDVILVFIEAIPRVDAPDNAGLPMASSTRVVKLPYGGRSSAGVCR